MDENLDLIFRSSLTLLPAKTQEARVFSCRRHPLRSTGMPAVAWTISRIGGITGGIGTLALAPEVRATFTAWQPALGLDEVTSEYADKGGKVTWLRPGPRAAASASPSRPTCSPRMTRPTRRRNPPSVRLFGPPFRCVGRTCARPNR